MMRPHRPAVQAAGVRALLRRARARSCRAIRASAGLTPPAPGAIVARLRSRWEGQMRHGRWMPWSVRAFCLIPALIALATPRADEAGGAAPGSFRAAQDQALDFSLRPVDLLNVTPGSPPGSFRAAQDVGLTSAWSRFDRGSPAAGYQGPGAPPTWAGGRERPLGSGAQRF
jgi:hypothetical protein